MVAKAPKDIELGSLIGTKRLCVNNSSSVSYTGLTFDIRASWTYPSAFCGPSNQLYPLMIP